MEVLQYLGDNETGFDFLSKYPNIKKVFMKFNTLISYSASVESIFSIASLIDTPGRHVLSDQTT